MPKIEKTMYVGIYKDKLTVTGRKEQSENFLPLEEIRRLPGTLENHFIIL